MSEREEPILEWIEGEQAAGRLAQPHVVERSQEVPATQSNDTQDDFEVVARDIYLGGLPREKNAAHAALQRIREERDALRAKAVQQGKYAVELAKQVAELTEHTAGLTEERDALRAERDEWKARAETHLHQREAALQVWEAAEDRIARLEEALSQVYADALTVHVTMPWTNKQLVGEAYEVFERLREVSRNALSQSTESPEEPA